MSKSTRNTKNSSSIKSVRGKRKSGSKEELPENVFDIYHGDFKVCDIPKTGPPKPDPLVEFRPKSKMIKDYNIDQTYAVMDKGPVKLKYRYTEAEYEWYPPGYQVPSNVSDKIRSRKQHGRGPLEELLQDAWAAVVEKHQKKIKEHNMKKHEEVRVKSIKEKKATEKLMLRILGPVWYQELSPKQCKVVDNLDQSMKRDMKHNSVSCTAECLAKLGLVNLPYHKHVELALKTSCGCPVEFLLILYDLRHPKRNVYTINERLLLSAVVRLTLRSTLKELHIRIPSPPGSPRKVKKKHAKVKPVHCESPYLVPYTFVPKPWIFNNYQKADKEYPQSFFFSYKEELIANLIKLCSENNIIAAVSEAEEAVESSESSTSNISATVDSNTCNLTAKTKCKLRIKGKDCLVTNEDTIECKLEIDYPTSSSTLSISSTTDTDCYAEMEKELVKEWIAAQRYYNKMFQTKCVSALHKTSIYIPCFLKAQTEKTKDSGEATKTDNSVSMVEEIPAIEDDVVEENKIECVDTTMPCIKEEQEPEKATCDAGNEIKENEDEEEGGEEKSSSEDCGCGCCLTNKSETDEESIITKNSNSECCALKQEFADIKRETSDTLNVNVNDTDYCFCKEKILQDIRDSCCQCEQCEADRRAANAKNTMIIADTKQGEDGDNVKIISGFKSEKLCTCMAKYEAQWEKVDAIRDVRKAQEALKSLNEKFVITGTTMGKDGKPVYILSSVQPKQECECIRKLKEIEEDKKRIALMPTLPEGCNQYIITGVHARPEGNIYILSGARKNPCCSCMDLYDEFTKNHSDCLELFEEYMKKIKHDTEEYMQEMNGYSEFTGSDNNAEAEQSVEEVEEIEGCPCACVCEENMKDMVSSLNKYIEEMDAEGEFENEESECSLYNLPAGECCDCLEEKESIVGPCGVTPERPCKIEESFETIEEIEEEQAEDDRFNRYIILNKLPEDPEEQLQLLKKALSKLAEDGFPLARLPEIHKLPHFKLWLKMRCRNFWTQKDKAKFMPTSRSNWKHVDMYRKDVTLPKKYFLLDKPEMQNWRYAKTIKDFNMSTKENFYRNVKWRSIDYARQLYPTFVSYEFPTKAFRDVFYAYLNSNENDVTPIRMWLTHEYRDQTILRKHCR